MRLSQYVTVPPILDRTSLELNPIPTKALTTVVQQNGNA